MSKLISIAALFALLNSALYCQDDHVLQKSYHNQLFNDVADDLEQIYDLQFFYRSEWTDSLRVVQEERNESLSVLLERTLTPCGIHFYLHGKQVFLSKEMKIDPSLLLSFRVAEAPAEPETVITFEEAAEEALPSASADRNRIIQIGTQEGRSDGSTATLNGYIREAATGEPILGAVVFNEETSTGVISDVNGYYVIELNKGRHLITYRSMGYQEEYRNVVLNGNGTLNLELEEKINQLKGVVITADKYQNVSGMQMGLNKIDVKTIKQVPAAMGEADVLKAALLLPGVQTVGEGASGFNVRGGSTDQNLILINGAPVFNTSHLFGFFSAFNPDVIQDFKLYKSGITADYGGRISSVFDISTRKGNRKRFSGMGGISPVTGRVVLEGPVIKEKVSMILGARSTYSDWLLKRINDPAIRNSSASFYDLNGNLNMDINTNNNLQISAYSSSDRFHLNSDTAYHYTNSNLVVNWKRIFNQKLLANFRGIFSNYAYEISSDTKPHQAFSMQYRIRYHELKTDFTYFPRQGHKMQFGASSIYYKLQPGSYSPAHEESLVASIHLENENALESSVYLSDEYHMTPELSLYGGIRYSFYAFLGPKTVYDYYQEVPLDPMNIHDTLQYGRGDFIQTYSGPELRLSLRYKLSGSSSVKVSYNRMRQYLNMLSNTTAVSPTDTWKLSDTHVRPQVGDQYAVGLYKDFRNQRIETSLEVYYKHIKDMIEYKGGANLIMNEFIEQDLINGKGRAYGAEVMVKRSAGKLNGWISYTFSRIQVKADSEHPVERINNGEWFPANHDKPHDITFVGNYKFSRRLSISSNLTYSTGRPITYPVAKYSIRNMTLLHYSYRNEYRIPDYFRWDMSVNVEGNLRSSKLAHSSWSISVYNVTGRDNVYSIYFVSTEKKVTGYKLSVFTQPVFTITYNFKF